MQHPAQNCAHIPKFAWKHLHSKLAKCQSLLSVTSSHCIFKCMTNSTSSGHLQLLNYSWVDDLKFFQWQIWIAMLYRSCWLWTLPRPSFLQHQTGILSVLHHAHAQDWKGCSHFQWICLFPSSCSSGDNNKNHCIIASIYCKYFKERKPCHKGELQLLLKSRFLKIVK